LLEGTNISEGRGTTRPFEIFGKPGIEPEELVKRLHQEELPGVKFRPLYFQPTFSKYQGELCGGAQIHIIDRQSFLPVLTGVAVICAIYQMDKEKFSWRLPPYEYETEKLPIDILAGTDKLRIQIESGCSLSEIYQSWQRDLDNFRKIRQQYLLYP
ncbi:MAG: DUF1343 domain-containing protein, partial [Desulfobacterota bacterium]|nr:DUF1343 domain-containing protein [Thermodesulfobacteriota bacterium]